MGLLYIILPSPPLVNTLSGTLSLGAVVHNRMAVFLVARRDFPLLADLDIDSFFLAGHNKEPVVVVVDNSVEQDTGKGTAVATVEVAGSCSK